MQKQLETMVISGSASLSEKMRYWRDYWIQKGKNVLAWPEPVLEKDFSNKYPKIHQKFYVHLVSTRMHFIANETKNGIPGYIGPGVFAEISFRIGLNLTRNENVPIILLNTPSKDLQIHDDIMLWNSLGWLQFYGSQ